MLHRMLTIIGIMVSLFAFTIKAEKTNHQVYVSRTNPTIGTKVHRAPSMLPSVELVYNTENNSIDIVCSCDCDAEVTVYDATGNIVAVSDIKDTIFLPFMNTSSFNVVIEAEVWYGTDEISY